MTMLFARACLLASLALACELAGAQSYMLSIDESRPLAIAVEALTERYRYVITYEDPRYQYEGDLVDVSEKVRKHIDRYPPGQVPKLMVPVADKLSVSVPPISSDDDMAALLTQLVSTKRAHGGHFRVLRTANIFHVVPTETRDSNGNWAPNPSILETRISLTSEEGTRYQLISNICLAVQRATGFRIEYSQPGDGLGAERIYRISAESEVARDVLMRAIALTSLPSTTWELRWDPQRHEYVLTLVGMPSHFGRPSPLLPLQPPRSSSSGSVATEVPSAPPKPE